jgi:hypothetical protein
MPRTELEERLWTPRELAERYGLAVGTLRNWRSLGIGPRAIKVGSKPRYPQSEVAAWEASRRRTT